MNRTKVLVVDDSAVVRQVLGGLLAADPGIEVIAACADPLLAMERKRKWKRIHKAAKDIYKLPKHR